VDGRAAAARGRPGSGALRATNAATAAGYVLGSELRACGVDFSFTPVLDLDWGRSGVIGDRAFHSDARVVTLLAKSLMHGLLQAGMANCGKHFPGHGWAMADSHTDVPVDERSLRAILADDAAPYGWLSSTLSSVMPAHVIYPKVDRRPAGFSARWLQDILRKQLRFQGAVFSDDLSMEGARGSMGRSSATPTPPWPHCRPAAIWCCCATKAWAMVTRWMPCSTAWSRRWPLAAGSQAARAKRAAWPCCPRPRRCPGTS